MAHRTKVNISSTDAPDIFFCCTYVWFGLTTLCHTTSHARDDCCARLFEVVKNFKLLRTESTRAY